MHKASLVWILSLSRSLIIFLLKQNCGCPEHRPTTTFVCQHVSLKSRKWYQPGKDVPSELPQTFCFSVFFRIRVIEHIMSSTLELLEENSPDHDTAVRYTFLLPARLPLICFSNCVYFHSCLHCNETRLLQFQNYPLRSFSVHLSICLRVKSLLCCP